MLAPLSEVNRRARDVQHALALPHTRSPCGGGYIPATFADYAQASTGAAWFTENHGCKIERINDLGKPQRVPSFSREPLPKRALAALRLGSVAPGLKEAVKAS
jgi:hypothetical protein